MQPYWKEWAGVEETSNSVDPAGGGKSNLDGKFGQFGCCVKSIVNAGTDLISSDHILDNFGKGGGVTALKLMGFDPDRSKTVTASMDVSINSVLRSELDPATGAIVMYKHSGYGSGVRVTIGDSRFSSAGRKNFDFARNLVLYILDFIPEVFEHGVESLLLKIPAFRQLQFAICGTLHQFKPGCINLRVASNKKQELSGAGMSRPGEGAGCAANVQAARANRMEKRCQKKLSAVEQIRIDKERSGVYCCSNRCPTTGRYCTRAFLTETGRDKHVKLPNQKACCFPVGIRGRDKFVLQASQAGGMLAVGSRPNRLSGSKSIVHAEAEAPGAKAADSFGRYNRKEGTTPYRKPKRLVAELRETLR